MSKRWGITSHEFSTLVSGHLRLRWWLLLLLLNGGQSLTDGLNCLSLHQEHLLDRHRGRGWQLLLLGCLILLSWPLLLSTPSPLRLFSDICKMQSHIRTDLATCSIRKEHRVLQNTEQMNIFTDLQHRPTQLLR
jgi:hypothetical protein